MLVVVVVEMVPGDETRANVSEEGKDEVEVCEDDEVSPDGDELSVKALETCEAVLADVARLPELSPPKWWEAAPLEASKRPTRCEVAVAVDMASGAGVHL